MIDGNLMFDRGAGNDKEMHYDGRCAILVTGNVAIECSLYSKNSDGTTANSFPANSILGIMAGNDMMVGYNSQLDIMGAFYAQGTISTQRQTTIMGTIVGSYFDMGTNVPDIYQVPILKDSLPTGMIGMFPFTVYAPVSWREISV